MNPWVVGIGGTVLELLFFGAGLQDAGAAKVFFLLTVLGVFASMAVFVKQGWDRGGIVGAYVEFERPLVAAMEGTPRPTPMRNAVIWLVIVGVVLSLALMALRPRAAGLSGRGMNVPGAR